MWVFAYGSLMSDGWERAFGGTRFAPAILLGFSRAFNKSSERNWGSKAVPGPTLGLEPEEGGQCVGVVFDFPDNVREQVSDALRRREGESFSFPELLVRLPDAREVQAITPVNDRSAETYIGKLTVAERAAMSRVAKGSSGAAAEYVRNVRDLLSSLGIEDPRVSEFYTELTKPIAEPVQPFAPAQPSAQSNSDEHRASMERLAAEIKDIILGLSPFDLMGYLWSQLQLAAMEGLEPPDASSKRGAEEEQEGEFSVADERQSILVALEYVHAVHSCFSSKLELGVEFSEERATRLLTACKELQTATMWYCMASTAHVTGGAFGDATAKLEFFAKNSWAFIRGNRYQGMEKEFLQFVLAPHDEAFRSVYGIGTAEIAGGIQDSANAMRSGIPDAANRLEASVSAAEEMMAEHGLSMEDVLERMKTADAKALEGAALAIQDILGGGICDVSAHTTLPKKLLDDLAFDPGTNSEFFAAGEFCGTPMRTMPARVKPLIKLEGAYLATDPYFIRDASYRAIQRGLLTRAPEYRNDWNKRQQQLSEHAMERILDSHFRGATVLHEIYYPGTATGEWAENDTLILLDDSLVQVEAKAGVAAMHSPATDFGRHVQKVRDLVLKAYHQTKRFLEYANSARIVPLFQRRDGKYEEILRLNLSEYRSVFPIGLTIESFSPYSTMCKELPEVAPILGKHSFFSLSIDDLFVMKRVLPTGGELFHYLEVRQQVAGIRPAFIFDELDHLGSYIAKNRFDHDLREHGKADMIVWDGFSKVIDDYFMSDRWKNEPPPHQEMPKELAAVLAAFETQRPRGWLKAQSLIRDLGGEGRAKLSQIFQNLVPSLAEYPRRWAVYGDVPTMLWLPRAGAPALDEMKAQAEAIRRKLKVAGLSVLAVSFDAALQCADVAYYRIHAGAESA